MVELGLDWSDARPGGAACAALGVKAVGRYLGYPGDSRIIEKPEYDDLTAHGVGVWFVREGAANSLLDGHDLGVAHAQSAVANLARLGLTNQVIYAAADFDVQPSQFPACDSYMTGFASVLGLENTGIYGGMRYINHCRDVLAKWYWQAGATSWDHDETGDVHIQQTTETPPLPGTDHNFIHNTNFGQVGSTLGDEMSQADVDAINAHTTSEINRLAEYVRRESRLRLYQNTATGQFMAASIQSGRYEILSGQSEVDSLVQNGYLEIAAGDAATPQPVDQTRWDNIIAKCPVDIKAIK